MTHHTQASIKASKAGYAERQEQNNPLTQLFGMMQPPLRPEDFGQGTLDDDDQPS